MRRHGRGRQKVAMIIGIGSDPWTYADRAASAAGERFWRASTRANALAADCAATYRDLR